MKSVNEKILVSCDLEQKEFIEVNGNKFKMALLFEKNYREKSPVLAIAQQTKDEITIGDILICHHNSFYQPSPYWIKDDLFSHPFNHTIFLKIDKDGNPHPVCGNLIVKKVNIPTLLPVPPEEEKQYIDRYIVEDGGNTEYKKGQLIFTKPHSGYTIVYIYNDAEYRVNKVNSQMVIGFI